MLAVSAAFITVLFESMFVPTKGKKGNFLRRITDSSMEY
jgi:hypothetical protein